MPAIEQICLPSAWRAAQLWPAVAQSTQTWLDGRGLLARDTIVLVPFAALLAPAREAFAARGGWQPRVETVLTLAATMGPAPAPEPGQCSGESTLDRLSASVILQRQAWARRWAQSDPVGFERIVASVVEAAQALRDAAHERAPSLRAEYWTQVRSGVGAPVGPAAAELLLLHLALEWAADAVPAPTDRLFELRPTAWVLLQIGGPDGVAEAVAGQGNAAALRLLADAPTEDPFSAVCRVGDVQRILCEDFEAEAQAAAAQVIDALNAGRAPVALVALDRALVRRVRVLLERDRIPLVDETGWVLATTRSAAALLALLSAAQASASQDTLLVWLKGWPGAAPHEVDSLEALWRERRHVPDRAAAQQLWLRAQRHLQGLTAAGVLPLAGWLRLLNQALASDGSGERLQLDAAGAQVLAALHVLEPGGVAWQQAAAQARLNLAGFIAWVQATLEQAPYLPPPDTDALVILTPLSRAFGRAFARIVVPGADHRQLGRVESPPSLIGDALAASLGLDHAAQRRTRQQLALAHLLRAEQLTLVRRHRDGDELLADSPAVEWLLLCRQATAASVWPLVAWQPQTTTMPSRPVPRPLPTAPNALPELLSATQLDALRACPYRFFARAVLRLDEAEELDAELAKRDYGNWLHAVLHHFHHERDYGAEAALQLQQAADRVTAAMGLDEGEMLPWRASFETFTPAYLAWCAAREAKGWYWADGESDHRCEPAELGGLCLRGRLDRLDHGPDGAQQLLDYKTGSVAALMAKVRQPLEDTQLAFYAALLGADASLSAAYVALDAPDAPREIVHPQVHDSAAVLLHGLGGEWQRLRQGAAMPALGEGPVCETCEARGLCRRDHWEAP